MVKHKPIDSDMLKQVLAENLEINFALYNFLGMKIETQLYGQLYLQLSNAKPSSYGRTLVQRKLVTSMQLQIGGKRLFVKHSRLSILKRLYSRLRLILKR
jgi:hypothetical protein